MIVPGWVRVAAALAVVVASFTAGYDFAAARARADRAEERLAAVEQHDIDINAARNTERKKTAAAEGIANESSQRGVVAAARAARAERANAGLLHEIARLNSRPAPEDPRAAAIAGEAAAARELLGTCAERHRTVAAAADILRDQVTGLQQFATQVCGAGE
ncbi:MAG: hypothetical protein ABI574_00845 [Burkholderiales bacterium]